MNDNQQTENKNKSPSTPVEIEPQSGDIYMSGKIEIKGDVITAGEMNKTAVSQEPIQQSGGWHPVGSYWLAAALLGVALLAGGMLRFWPAVDAAIGTTVTILAMLLQLFAVGINQEESKRFSHTIAQYQYGKVMILCVWIGATSSLFWHISVIKAGDDPQVTPTPSINADSPQEPNPTATATVQPEPENGVPTFGIGIEDRGGLTDTLSGILPHTRDVLYQKLDLADNLQGISWDSPQVNEDVRQNLDWWIVLSIRHTSDVKISATLSGKGGVARQTVNRDIPRDTLEGGRDEICLLDLQNQLAKEILKAMELNLEDDILTTMDETPTMSCEALQLNNRAADILIEEDYQAAQPLLQKALSFDRNYGDAYNNMGRYYYREKQWGIATIWHIRAIALEPDNPTYHFNLGLSYERQEDYPAAVTTYKKAVTDDPAFLKGWNNLGFTYLLMGEIDLAGKALNIAVSLIDDKGEVKVPALYKNLGRLYLAQDKPAEAIKALEEALQQIPVNETYPEALYYLVLANQAPDQVEDSCFWLWQYNNSGDDEPSRLEDANQRYANLECSKLFSESD